MKVFLKTGHELLRQHLMKRTGRLTVNPVRMSGKVQFAPTVSLFESDLHDGILGFSNKGLLTASFFDHPFHLLGDFPFIEGGAVVSQALVPVPDHDVL